MNLLKNKLEYLTKMSLDRKIKSKWFKIANILLAVLIIAVFNIDSIITFFGGDFNEKTKYYGIQIKKLDAFFNFFLQKYPFGECGFF